MKIKTENLEGGALDWAVGHSLGWKLKYIYEYNPCVDGWGRDVPGKREVRTRSAWKYWHDEDGNRKDKSCEWTPSAKWSQAGPLIEQNQIDLSHYEYIDSRPEWQATALNHSTLQRFVCCGPTPLIAAMRALVRSKLGGEVDVPDELNSL